MNSISTIWNSIFGNREQPAPAPVVETAIADPLEDKYEKDKVFLIGEADRLLQAVKEAGLEGTSHYQPYDFSGERFPLPYSTVNFTDPKGISHSVQINPGAKNVGHTQYYDRKVSFSITPVSKETLLENPALAMDSLRRSGILENITDEIKEDEAAAKLIAIGENLPGVLPGVLNVSIHDPVHKTAITSETIVPPDAIVQLRGAKGFRVSGASHLEGMPPRVEIAFGLPYDHHRQNFVPPADKSLPYAGNIIERSMRFSSQNGEIQIPLANFTGHGITVEDKQYVKYPEAIANSPLSHVYRSHKGETLDAVIEQVRGMKAPQRDFLHS